MERIENFIKKFRENYQLVSWYPHWEWPQFIRMDENTGLRLIYEWVFFFGFWELRKWAKWDNLKTEKMGRSAWKN